MKNKNELHIIEKKYDVHRLKVNEFYAWPILRQGIYFEIFNKKVSFNIKHRTRNKLQLLKNFFYGFHHFFKLKNYDFLFFNNADKRTIKKENKFYDGFFDAWADKVGQDKSLFIEWAINKHFPRKHTYSKNVISDLGFKLGCFVCSLFTTIKVEEFDIYKQISKEMNLKTDSKRLMIKRYAEIRFYRFIFRKIKPKLIFLISSFTKETIVIAAHLENIKVFEMQHGYIGDNHQFYKIQYDFGQLYYPDYLVSFGTREKNFTPKNFIFKNDQIIPVGSLYLENIKDSYSNETLENLTSKYNKVFCVSLQNIEEEKLLNWVCKQAERNGEWLFILKPRHVKRDYSKYTRLDNCVLILNNNIYEILKYSHYNITIYSTTAVEASIFNVKTLFYNLDNLSNKYFDVDSLNAALIEEGQAIHDEHLNTNEAELEPYFISGYYKNVEKTKLAY